MSTFRRHLPALFVLAVAIAAYWAATAAVSLFIPDDSYISFRYAEHVSAGKGLRFNESDPPVEGYSNFLWVLVCAALHSTSRELPTTASQAGRYVGVMALFVLWLLYIRRRIPTIRMLAPLVLAATAGPLVIYAVSGLETTLFAFLLVLLLWTFDRFLERKRIVDAVGFAVAGFLAALCRPEGVLALPAIVAVMWLGSRREPGTRGRGVVIAVAVFGVLYAAYTAWRVAYFDSVVPTPFLSKRGGGITGAWVANLTQDFVRHRNDFPQIGYYVAALFVLAVAGVKVRANRFGTNVETAALTLGLLYAIVYINFVDWMPGMRYYAGLVPVLFVPIARVWTFGGPAASSYHQRIANGRYAVVAAAALLVSLSVLSSLQRTVKRVEEGNRFCVLPLAQWLDTYTPPNWRLAMGDVGAVPYYSKRYTIDINPRPLTDAGAASKGWSEHYFYSKKPDIVVLVSRGLFEPRMYPEHAVLMKTARFDNSYRLIGAARQSWYEDRSYWVYFRRESPPLDAEALMAFPIGVGLMHRVEKQPD
jgi:hypothetical protein